MANDAVYVVPGVFTRERDQSFLQKGLSAIGAAFIGNTPKGPAFIPTQVGNFSEYQVKFGTHDETYKMPYAVQQYLKYSGIATIVRVLGLGGYLSQGFIPLIITNTGSTSTFLGAKLRATASGTSAAIVSGAVIAGDGTKKSGALDDFDIHVSGGVSASYLNMSIVPGDNNNIKNILGTDPRGTNYLYVDEYYEWACAGLSSSMWFIRASGSDTDGVNSWSGSANALNDYTYDYTNAETSWIHSQRFGTAPTTSSYNLFKLYTIAHGNTANTDIKVGIQDMTDAPVSGAENYGTFTVVVRKYDDTDRNPTIYESFSNLNINPNSNNYIAKRIGDRYFTTDSEGAITFHGEYDLKSDYIRVEMNENIGTYPQDILPWGFRAYTKEQGTTSTGAAPDMPYNYSQEWSGEYSSKVYYGIDFTKNGLGAKFRPLVDNASQADSRDFWLDAATGSDGIYSGTINPSATNIPRSAKKFALGFYKGFDGVNPTLKMGYDNGERYNTAVATRSGAIAFRRAIDTIRSPDEYDFNLLVMPGLKNSPVTNYALEMVEDRGDAFYLMDICHSASTVTNAVDAAAAWDSSYAATFFPWVKLFDTDNDKYVWVPPTVPAAGAIAYNDRVGFPWYAPAGLNRGALSNVKEAAIRLKASQLQELYINRVNPLRTFPDAGVVIWGQKTLQIKSSALDRISVRRLLIYARKAIASTTKYLVFEPNSTTTWTRFESMVNPILRNIAENNGLYAFKVVMDNSTNTPDLIDQNIMYGKIYLQPTRTAEILLLDFNISRTGAEFTE